MFLITFWLAVGDGLCADRSFFRPLHLLTYCIYKNIQPEYFEFEDMDYGSWILHPDLNFLDQVRIQEHRTWYNLHVSRSLVSPALSWVVFSSFSFIDAYSHCQRGRIQWKKTMKLTSVLVMGFLGGSSCFQRPSYPTKASTSKMFVASCDKALNLPSWDSTN